MGPAFIRLNIIAILLLLLGSHPVWAAEGFVTIDSHDALQDYCHAQNFKVSGQLSLQSDNEPSRIEKNSGFCDGRKASLKPQSTLPMCRSTHAVLYYRIDGGEEKYLKKVQSYYLSDWTQVGKTLNYSITVKTDQLQPGPHTLSVIFKDAFGVSCYRYKYGWGYQSTHIGDTIDQASISFSVPDPDSGTCENLMQVKKPKNLGGSGHTGTEQIQETEADKAAQETIPVAGEPINFCTGNYYTKETDLLLEGPGLHLSFVRFYNSQGDASSPLGHGWTSSFVQHLVKTEDALILHEADGREVHFQAQGDGFFVSETGKPRTIEVLANSYRLTEPDGTTLDFDLQGRLTTIADRNGNSQTLSYENGMLMGVDDSFGRTLEFGYDAENRLQSMITPIGTFHYAYDQGNLVRVTDPSDASKQYLYQDPEDPHLLTGIVNENGILFTAIEYDDQDRAVSSTFPDDLYRVFIDYGDDPKTRVVTDSLGRETHYEIAYQSGIGRVVAAQGTGGGTSPTPVGTEYELSPRQQVVSRTGPNGSQTTYAYDDRPERQHKLTLLCQGELTPEVHRFLRIKA